MAVSLLSKIITFKRLGFTNLWNVFIYRLLLKSGYFTVKLPIKTLNPQNKLVPFFQQNTEVSPLTKGCIRSIKAFGWLDIDTNTIPDWHASVLSGKALPKNQQHWSKLNDFDLATGDIKTVWELSRFTWSVIFAVNYKQSPDDNPLEKLNLWLSDWCFHNPVNQGVNWKCGQEASIRVMHLAAAHYLINQKNPLSEPLAELIYQHLLRISPTVHYAMAQDNNHGTSEAAALYIGSLLLKSHSNFATCAEVKNWQKIGQYWLQNRAVKLIDDDGCFSQNSVNYHRLMLDTLSLTEFFRQQMQQPEFNQQYYLKVRLSCYWLFNLTNPTTGKTPLLGLNDGAQLLPLTACGYHDYRPSVQWAFHLFLGGMAYHEQGSYDQLHHLFSTSTAAPLHDDTAIKSMPLNTSYHQVSNSVASCYIRTPNLKFRPACCDALHLDFWLGNDNLFVSTGSYSYNCEQKYQQYFPSVKSHSTVQFDHMEQMPNISRFLYSHWIATDVKQLNSHQLSASYHNGQHQHQRQLVLSDNSLEVTDRLSGFSTSVTLRWQLAHREWHLNNNKLTSGQITIEISADLPIKNIKLAQGLMSRYYLQKEGIPVLEITLEHACVVKSKISWH